MSLAKRSTSAGFRIDGTFGGQRRTLEVEAAPEHEHGVQHQVRVFDEAVFVDVAVLQDLCELVLRVLRVVGFDAGVPGEEAHVERLPLPALAIAFPARDELIPKTCSGPVLDGP